MVEEWLLFQKVDLPHRRFCLPAVSLWPNLCGCCDCKNVNWEISSLASISYFLVFFFVHFEEIPIKCQMILVTITFTCSWLLPPWLSPDYHHGLNNHGYHHGTIIKIVINENLPSHWPFIRAIAFSASTWIFHFFLSFLFLFVWFSWERGCNSLLNGVRIVH